MKLTVCLMLLAACAGSLRAEINIDPNLPADTAATVNGQAIPRRPVEAFLRNDHEALGLDDADLAKLALLPAAILDELVERALILQETRRRGIEPTEDQIDAEEKELVEFYGSNTRATWGTSRRTASTSRVTATTSSAPPPPAKRSSQT